MKILGKYGPLLTALLILWGMLASIYRADIARTAGHFVYELDDPYIHMAMAKNFARYNVWGVSRTEFSSATSSPLWTLLLGVLFKITGVQDMTAFWLNILFASLSLCLLHHLLAKRKTPPPIILGALLAVIFLVPLPQIIFGGMEHSMHIFMVLLFAALLLTFRETRRGLSALCLAAALMCATRYESLFIVASVVLFFALRRDWRPALLLAVVSPLPALLYGAVSVHYGALWLPNSIVAKAIVGRTFLQENPLSVILTRAMIAPQIYGLVLAVAVLAGVRWVDGRRAERDNGLLLSSIFLLTALLHLKFIPYASVQWNCRYQAYLLTLGMTAFALNFAEYLTARQADVAEAEIREKKSLFAAGVLLVLTLTVIANLLFFYALRSLSVPVLIFGPMVLGLIFYFALLDPAAERTAFSTTLHVAAAAGGFGVLAGAAVLTGNGQRFEPYLVLLSLFSACFSLWKVKTWTPNPGRFVWPFCRVALYGSLALALPMMAYQSRKNLIYIVTASYNIYEIQVQMGCFLHQFYHGEGVVINDIGASMYFADVRCVDLLALGSVEVVRLRQRDAFTLDSIRQMAETKQCRIGLVHDGVMGDTPPDNWVKVGSWHISDDVVSNIPTLSFYATSAADAPALIQHLREYAPSLPSTVEQSGAYCEARPASAL